MGVTACYCDCPLMLTSSLATPPLNMVTNFMCGMDGPAHVTWSMWHQSVSCCQTFTTQVLS